MTKSEALDQLRDVQRILDFLGARDEDGLSPAARIALHAARDDCVTEDGKLKRRLPRR